MQTNWKDINLAPKDNSNKLNYILISDGICVPDLVIWRNTTKEKIVNGNICLSIAEGWFTIHGSRSRILNPTIFHLLPELP